MAHLAGTLPAMRILALVGVLVALVALAGADEGEDAAADKQSPYAALGFPVTINEEIITVNDVARAAGIPLDQIPPVTLRTQRDILLNRKISERVAAELEIEVADREVEEYKRREIEERQGEAKFFEYLAQRGQSLERWRLEKRQEVLEAKLRMLFQSGVTPDQRKLLPARIKPTPREIRIAWQNDPGRRSVGRVRRLKLVVDVDAKLRRKLAAQQVLSGKPRAWVQEEIGTRVKKRLEAILAELEKRDFLEVAKEHGVDVDSQGAEWVPVTGGSASARFLQAAAEKARSKPIPLPQGRYQILYLLERERPDDRNPTDPVVAAEYQRRIRALRAAKWESILRIRALDGSSVQPERVRAELRDQFLAILREATEGLRRLGLH